MSKELYEIEFPGFSTKQLNDVRRFIISKVKTLAITEVLISINTTPHDDEVIAHRISQIPILSNPGDFEEVIGNRLTEKNTVIISLDIINNTVENQYILSDSLNVELMGNQQNIEIPFKDIIIGIIQPNQQLRLKALATLGSGSVDSKFSPVSAISIDSDQNLIKLELIGNIDIENLDKAFDEMII